MKSKKSHPDILRDPTISEREKYKYYTENDKDALELREKVRTIVAEKRLSSVMNDTKWLELQNSIPRLPFPPPYIEKLVLENKNFEDVQISDSPPWIGNWSPFYEEGMSLFFAIEYIKVKPRYVEHNGNLVAPKIVDETEEFEQLLNELHIPYEIEEGTFTIYGYK